MKSNLYFANFLIGDYAKSNEIYNEILAKVNSEIEANKSRNESVIPSFKRTPATKALDSMKDIRDMELREAALYDVFKTRFGY